MAIIGSLVVDLKADIARFSSDLAKARTEIAGVGTSAAKADMAMARLGRTLKGALGAFGVSLGFQGARQLVDMVKGALDAAGALGELAEQMGITTRTLQVLQFAAVQSGVEVGELEAGIQRFSRSIGEAAEGNKAMIENFERLGVKLLDAGGNLRSTDTVLREVTAAIAAIEDPARRAAAAADLFGRGGVKLLPILNLGEEGFNEFAAAADAAGVVLSDQMVKDADDAADAIARLEFMMTRWWQKLVIEGVPAFEGFFDRLGTRIDALHEISDDFEVFAANAISAMVRVRQETEIFSAATIAEFEKIHKWFAINAWINDAIDQAFGIEHRSPKTPTAAEIGAAVGAGASSIGIALDGPTGDEGPPVGGLPSMLPSGAGRGVSNPPPSGGGGKGKTPADFVKDLRFELEQLGRTPLERDIFKNLEKAGVDMASAVGAQIADLTTQIHNVELAEDAASEAFKRGAADAIEQDKAREEAAKRAQDLIAQRAEIFAGLGQELEQREALIAALGESAEAYELEARFQEVSQQFRQAGMPLYGQEVEGVRKFVGQLKELDDRLAAMQRFDAQMKELGTTLSTDVAGGIADVISGTRSLDEVWQELLKTILEGIAKIIDAQAGGDGGGGGWLDDILGGAVDWLGGLLGLGSGSGGAVGGSTGGTTNQRRAGGGPVGAGGTFLVGEQGPELFVPHASGAVLPAGLTAALAGGAGGRGGVVINLKVVNTTGEPSEVRQRNGGQEIEVLVGRAIASDAENMGPGSRAIARRFGLTAAAGNTR